MTIRYKIFEDRKLVYVAAEGVLTYDDLNSHLEELAKDPRYTPPMLKLVDYRRLSGYGISTRESELFSLKKASLSDRFLNERCAFVVPSDLGFGMARHHQAFIDEHKIETNIFRDMEEAKKWLGIDLPDDELTGLQSGRDPRY